MAAGSTAGWTAVEHRGCWRQQALPLQAPATGGRLGHNDLTAPSTADQSEIRASLRCFQAKTTSVTAANTRELCWPAATPCILPRKCPRNKSLRARCDKQFEHAACRCVAVQNSETDFASPAEVQVLLVAPQYRWPGLHDCLGQHVVQVYNLHSRTGSDQLARPFICASGQHTLGASGMLQPGTASGPALQTAAEASPTVAVHQGSAPAPLRARH